MIYFKIIKGDDTMDIILDNGKPKYLQIYEQIAQMINEGILKGDEKLPSKRILSLNLNVSINTILNAYNLLLDEGFIYTKEKKGYYVTHQPYITLSSTNTFAHTSKEHHYKYDFTTQNVEPFNNKNWKKITKEILDHNLHLQKSPFKGNKELRMAIAKHLKENRGISTDYHHIIIGSGMEMFEHVLNILNYSTITLENPGYHKLSSIAYNLNMTVKYLPLDDEGVIIPKGQTLLYTTPFNQFPTGIKMSITRKKELIQWANNTDSFIIEDDFDAEFRINSAPTTSLFSLSNKKVIFFSTFSTTLFPGLRISYAILPDDILKIYEIKYKTYSSSVPTLEQLTLKEFILSGYYAAHLNRRKKLYIKKRDSIIKMLFPFPNIKMDYKKNYLSLLIQLETNLEDDVLISKLKEKGIKIQALSDFDIHKEKKHIFILGYTAITLENLNEGLKKLMDSI